MAGTNTETEIMKKVEIKGADIPIRYIPHTKKTSSKKDKEEGDNILLMMGIKLKRSSNENQHHNKS